MDFVEDEDSVDIVEIKNIANGSINPLKDASVPDQLIIGETLIQLQFRPVMSLAVSDRKEIFNQVEENVKVFYELEWGWNENERKKEMFSSDARYIMALDHATGKLLGWTMFKFDWDDLDEPEHAVLFCYELHVSLEFRGSSLGTQLLQVLVRIANHFRMWKTMLTCFKANERAMHFYAKNGFQIDSNSPSRHGHMEECYEILSNKPDLV